MSNKQRSQSPHQSIAPREASSPSTSSSWGDGLDGGSACDLQDLMGNAGVGDMIHRLASGGSSAGDPGAVFKGATGGGGGEIPYRAEMESAFGQDFSSVQAHTGRAGAMQDLGAKAAAQGEQVAFAETNPGKEVVAHELTHVVQARHGAGGVQGFSELSSPADSSESEARSVASRVVAGSQAGTIGGGGSASIHRADPATLTDTAHQQPELSDGTNHVPTTNITEERDETMNVRVLHAQSNPLQISGDVREEDLYEVVNREPASSTEPGVESIVKVVGSVALPENAEHIERDALFIDGKPSVNDIQQGGIGSCFFLASITNIVAQDPGQIASSISGNAAGASANFFRYDAAANNWVACSVGVTNTLLMNLDAGGNKTSIHGSGFMVAEDPLRSEWWVEAQGGTLTVHREDWYETAMWAPLMEKAYAAYSQQYGQYGGFDSANANTQPSGYDQINGGIAQYSYRIMYGNDAQEGSTDINFNAGQNNVLGNLPAIENILRVMGQDPTMAADQEFMMSVGISPDTSVERLGSMVDAILAMPTSNKYPLFRKHMESMKTEISAWKGAAAADKETRLEPIKARARNFATPGNWPLLHYETSPKEYKDLNELCNVVMNLGDDSSNGQRFTYAWHSYSVMGASFADKDSKALALTTANLAAEAAKIDPVKSSVQLRNPHGTNEPNEHATTDPAGQDGSFSLSLDQFFRVFAFEQHGLVKV